MFVHRPYCLRVAGILLAMLALALVVVWPILRDHRGTEVTRYRNALRAESGVAEDFAWTPANWPSDFQREQGTVPPALKQWPGLQNSEILDVWPRSLKLAGAITSKAHKGNMIAKPTMATLKIMEETGAGYCADYTKVFNAIAYAGNIQVRQWSFSFDGFGGWGHTFNEVWDDSAKRWKMIDVFNGFYPRDLNSGEVLSALEFRDRLFSAPKSIVWERLEKDRFGFQDDAEAFRYFRRGANEWYLWWGNDPLTYDANFLVALAAKFGRMPEQVAGLLTGAMPRFKILLSKENELAVATLHRVKTFLLAAAISEALLFSLLVWQLTQWRRSVRQ
ncbi:MAG: hypothetical protein V4447_00930 [Pseudomonadota bacterium]